MTAFVTPPVPVAPSPSVPLMGRGLWLGVIIFGAWLASLLGLLLVDLSRLSPAGLIAAIALRTFLQTGLFILGHDAMHRSLVPGFRSLNDRLGHLALLLYAGLPYRCCRRNHLRHHRSPGSAKDPDFRSRSGDGPWSWYRRFMGNYLSLGQMASLLGAWLCFALLLQAVEPVRAFNVLVFWTVPLVLSSLQLFVFGTYLPHRSSAGSGDGSHQVQSLGFVRIVSLLACYHFGYHWEHHAFPGVPWFRLPELRRTVNRVGPGGAALALPLGGALPS